uniref:Uncharacterized protein n=1 Tax=Oryza brachyantha TaxID=4533 RepID=J3N7X4_ORYBR
MRGAAASPLLWKMKRLLNIGSETEIKKAIRLINGLAAAMIQEHQKLGVGSSHDLLSRFMASAGDAHGAAEDKFLRDIVVSFLLAGRDIRAHDALRAPVQAPRPFRRSPTPLLEPSAPSSSSPPQLPSYRRW